MTQRIPEGERVAYIGDGEPDIALVMGSIGRVVRASGNASHVQWVDGQISLVSNLDIVSIRGQEDGDDSLEGPIVSMSVRDVYEKQGTTGLLNALNDEGHLAFFEPLAEEAVELIAAAIRNDVSFRSVLSSLGPQEGDNLIALATSTLLRDAFARS